MKRGKRWLALLLAVALGVGMVPVTAEAEVTTIYSSSDYRISEMLNKIASQNFSGSNITTQQARQKIEYLLYNNSFPAIGSGTFPYYNSGSYVYSVWDGNSNISINGAKGCMAYCNYADVVVYGTKASTRLGEAYYTASTLKELLQKNAQAGEHIRVDNKHSLTFISCDDSGFYCLSYNGDSDPRIYLQYRTYEQMVTQYSGYKIWIYNNCTSENNTCDHTSGYTVSLENGSYVARCKNCQAVFNAYTYSSSCAGIYKVVSDKAYLAAAPYKEAKITNVTISKNQELTVTGNVINAHGNSWFIVSLNGNTYYVSDWYNNGNICTSLDYLRKDRDLVFNENDILPTYGTITISKKNNMKTLPCREDSDALSKTILELSPGIQLTATGLVKNRWDNYWYRVSYEGKTGYVYAGDASFQVNDSDITASIASVDNPHTKGAPFYMSGTISYHYLKPKLVAAYICPGTTFDYSQRISDAYDSSGANPYNISGSVLDSNLKFGSLGDGVYTYAIAAHYIYYYSSDGKTAVMDDGRYKMVHEQVFAVGSGQAPTHTHTWASTTSAGEAGHNCICSCGQVIEVQPHNYGDWIVTTEATISQTGTRYRSCTVCGYQQVETIPVLPHTHDYSEVWATDENMHWHTCSGCDEKGDYAAHTFDEGITSGLNPCTGISSTIYTCTVCGYQKTVSESSYTEWSEATPTGIAADLIETKTQYRTQTKETTSSDSPELEGWTPCGSSVYWGEWGAWSGWCLGQMAASETRQVETTILYRYYAFVCTNCGSRSTYSYACSCGGSRDWNENWVPLAYQNSASYATNGKRGTTSLGDGVEWYFSSTNLSDTAAGTTDQHRSGDSVVIDYGYHYRDRVLLTNYRFYRWSDWSEWSDTPAEASDTQNVEMRTLYRTLKATGHTYSDTWENDMDGHWHECSACGDKVDYAAHTMETEIVAPSAKASGYTLHTCSLCGYSYRDTFTRVDTVGDVNGDEVVNILDLACLYTWLSEGKNSGQIAEADYFRLIADANGDSSVNILDYQSLYERIKSQ